MRRYKIVKEKKITYPIDEWKAVERRAAALNLKTGTFIRRISVDGQIIYYDMKEAATVLNALRIIGKNINQIARKANEINSIYADDIDTLQKEYAEICHTLMQFLSDLSSDKNPRYTNIA